MEELEIKEKIEETEKGHEESQSSKLRIGLLIAALAALLALLEAGGKSAQTEAINANLQASDLWTFFQAKTARITTIQTAAESARLSLLSDLPTEAKAAIQKQIDAWNATVARYDSESQTGEGRKELTERAKEAEAAQHPNLPSFSPRLRSSPGSFSWSISLVPSDSSVSFSASLLGRPRQCCTSSVRFGQDRGAKLGAVAGQ